MNKKIVEEAEKWLGTPHINGARVKGSGVDCGQLLIAAAEDSGALPEGTVTTGIYSPDWPLHRSEEKYLEKITEYCDKVEGPPEAGDFALFKFGRCVSHGGIVVNWPLIIHSFLGLGVIYSDFDDAMLCDKRGRTRLAGVYRLRKD